MAGTLVLVVESGPAAGQRFELSSGAHVGGRSSDCEVPVQDAGLSRRHFELSWDGASCRLADLESTNGTFVNGRSVSAAELRDGDRVLAGDSLFRVEIAGPPPASSAPASAPVSTLGSAPPPPPDPASPASQSPPADPAAPAAVAAASAPPLAESSPAAPGAPPLPESPPAAGSVAAPPGSPSVETGAPATPESPPAPAGASPSPDSPPVPEAAPEPASPGAPAAPVAEPPSEPIELFSDLDPEAARQPAQAPEPDSAQAALMVLLAEGGSDAVFAIVDGAKALPLALYARLLGHRLFTLFGPELAPAGQNGPILIPLEPEPLRFLARWSEALGGAPGLLFQSAADLPVCFAHLHRVFHARNEQGELELVRFYDPATLRGLLGGATPEARRSLFGPVSRFVLEDEAGDAFEGLLPEA